MKNLLIYTNPKKEFDKETLLLSKIQIHNSLELGWNPEDILLMTNFEYEYLGVKSVVISNDFKYDFDKLSNKIFVIKEMLANSKETYWYHDFDAYQMEELNPVFTDIGLSDYGWSTKWNCGSIFFRENSADIFDKLHHEILERKTGDERVLTTLTKEGLINNSRITRLNITYNFGMRNIGTNYALADKPIKIAHFHPWYNDIKLPANTRNLFIKGNNEIGKPLVTPRLIKLFDKYDIR